MNYSTTELTAVSLLINTLDTDFEMRKNRKTDELTVARERLLDAFAINVPSIGFPYMDYLYLCEARDKALASSVVEFVERSITHIVEYADKVRLEAEVKICYQGNLQQLSRFKTTA